MLLHSPRRAHDHLGAVLQRANLRPHRHPAAQRQHLDIVRPPRQPAQVLGHLIRQLAGRAEHQGLTAEKARVQRVQQAQPERRRLPGAGLGLGDHIPPLQDQRQALRLDRRHLGKPQRRQRRQSRRGKGEGSEVGIGHGWACCLKGAAV